MSSIRSPSTAGGRELHQSEAVCCTVTYEDTVSRDRALRLCDDLVRALWKELEFEFSWWRFDYLGDETIARAAAESALKSDIAIFSVRSGFQLPVPVRAWAEDWAGRRLQEAGVLVALIGTVNTVEITPVHTYLRRIATRASMDYLPPLPELGSRRSAMSFEEIERRANGRSTLLNDILDHPGISSHWGINE
jgi:hypothetical protein